MKSLFVSWLLVSAALISTSAESPAKNVILIYIDDLGYGDIGPFGCEDIPTPHLDQLATEGVVCTTSYITNPPCCPSRCALIMGQYGQRFGKYGMSRGLPIPDPEDRPNLARFLTDHGYATGHIGKWDIGTKAQGPLQMGFSQVARKPPVKVYTEEEAAVLPGSLPKQLKKKGYQSKYFCLNEAGETQWLTDYDGDSMIHFIEHHQETPFFLYWSPEAVHSTNQEAPESLTERTAAKPNRRKLAGAIVSIDDQIGKLLSHLTELGLRESTLVIFSSDNGANGSEGGSSSPYTGGKGGGTQKEGWVRVPTIFSLPGTLPQDTRYDGMIANFDFYSTIASYIGQPIPAHCDGVDLFPWLTGAKTGDAHDHLFWLNNEPGDAERRHLIAARWKDYRLYRKYEEDPWQLFDLNADPREESDLAAQYPEIVKELANRHASWAETLAPLGMIPKVSTSAPIIPTGHGWATSSAALSR